VAVLAANWKLHKSTMEAVEWVRAVKASPLVSRAEVVVLPGFLQISAVAAEVDGTGIQLGVQDVFWEETGAYTGMVSATQAREAGCSHALISHSERRRYAADDDSAARKRIRAALRAGLTPIYCIGEDIGVRRAGDFRVALRAQYDVGFEGLSPDEARQVVVAYEPVWAIGSGQPASPAEAAEVAESVRQGVRERTGLKDGLQILYGGSVTPGNVSGYLTEAGMDGVLVGSASLDAMEFLALLKAVVGNG
jgi:triosephosphate isomerase